MSHVTFKEIDLFGLNLRQFPNFKTAPPMWYEAAYTHEQGSCRISPVDQIIVSRDTMVFVSFVNIHYMFVEPHTQHPGGTAHIL